MEPFSASAVAAPKCPTCGQAMGPASETTWACVQVRCDQYLVRKDVPGVYPAFPLETRGGRTERVGSLGFKLDSKEGQSSITCLTCGMASYHPQDIEHRYCGRCRRFHDNGQGEPLTE